MRQDAALEEGVELGDPAVDGVAAALGGDPDGQPMKGNSNPCTQGSR